MVSCEGNSEESVNTEECCFVLSNMIEGSTYSFTVEAYDEFGTLIADGSCESTLPKPEEPTIKKIKTVKNIRVIRDYNSVILKWSTVSAYWFSEGVYRIKLGKHKYSIKAIYCSGGQSKPEAKKKYEEIPVLTDALGFPTALETISGRLSL